MPQRVAAEFGSQIFHVWDVHEYTKFQHTKRWYTIVALLMVSGIVYALLTDDYFFAIILILIAFIYGYHDMREPALTQFGITDRGVVWRGFLFQYKEIANFFIIYEPEEDVKKIYFVFKRSTTPRLGIALDEQDPNDIRATLRQFIREDLTQENEPLSDALGHVLKF